MDFLDRIELEHPVVQAGMGGGVAGGELAGAVSAAGGLGTVGMTGPASFGAALVEAQRRAGGRPVAANLLTPFIKRAHVDACIAQRIALVVLHGGLPASTVRSLRTAKIPIFATVGTAEAGVRALRAGADGLVVQGIEAGGHLVAVEGVHEALRAVREVAGPAPLFAAGGVAERHDVERLLEAGADAAVAGTSFLLTEESRAHPGYKQRVLAADRTLETLLFGLGWPMRHRVVPNTATDRWCSREELGPRWVRRVSRLSAPLGRVLPLDALGMLVAAQHPAVPLLTPALPLRGMPDRTLDRAALYAGESHRRIHAVRPAVEVVEHLVRG